MCGYLVCIQKSGDIIYDLIMIFLAIYSIKGMVIYVGLDVKSRKIIYVQKPNGFGDYFDSTIYQRENIVT